MLLIIFNKIFGVRGMAAVVAMLCVPGVAAWAQPVVQSASPAAVPSGKTTQVVLRGQKLNRPLKVWTSLPADVKVLEDGEHKGPESVKLEINFASVVPAQVGGLVVATAEGASEPFFLAVDDLPSVADNGKNHTLAESQEIPSATAVDGTADGTLPDVYKFQASAGEQLAVEVLAARIGSDLDPIVRLLDANRREVAFADDDLAFGSDGRFVQSVSAAGTYHLEVRDVRYRGGPNFRYRLRLTRSVENQPWEITPAVSLIAAPIQERQFATAGAAKQFALPGAIQGTLEMEKERDEWLMSAKAGTYTFRPLTRTAGHAGYLSLAIYKPDGSLLAESAVTENEEQPLTVAFPTEGQYRFVVSDLLKRGGPQFKYIVEAAPHAGFELTVKPDKAAVGTRMPLKEGAMLVEVLATRSGYDGPIELSVEPASAGVSVLNHVIGAKQPGTKLLLRASATAAGGDLLALRIVGKAEHQGHKFTVPVRTAGLVRVKTPAVAFPPAWLDGLIPAGVGGQGPTLFALTAPGAPLTYPRGAAQLSFTLVMDRKNGEFKDQPVNFAVENLPAGVTYEVKREGNGPQEKYHVALKAPRDIGELKQEIRVVGYADFKGQAQVTTSSLPLETLSPLVIAVTPAGPITKGQKQMVKVAISRYGAGEDRQPVTIKWKKLPAGVTGPAETVIAADQVEAKVELVAAADAAAGVFDGLVVEAATKFRGVDVVVESGGVKWEVR